MSNRREFITLLGGEASWPLAARAQQPEGDVRSNVSKRKYDRGFAAAEP